MSLVGVGCNNFGGRLDAAQSGVVINRAIERGVTLFDTADSYGGRGRSEEILGSALAGRREGVVIATKFGWPMDDEGKLQGASRAYVFSAAEASLRRLRTDRIDLYQLHRPDPQTPIEETLSALSDLAAQGKVRFIGCSNFKSADLDAAMSRAAHLGLPSFVSCQNHYNLLTRDIEADLIPAMRRHGTGLLPYAPLAGGLLTGKYHAGAPMPVDGRLTKAPSQAARYLKEGTWSVIEALRRFSAERGRTLLDLAISWLAAQNVVPSVIAGAMSAEQVDMNIAAAQWTLTPDELKEIDRLCASASAHPN